MNLSRRALFGVLAKVGIVTPLAAEAAKADRFEEVKPHPEAWNNEVSAVSTVYNTSGPTMQLWIERVEKSRN